MPADTPPPPDPPIEPTVVRATPPGAATVRTPVAGSTPARRADETRANTSGTADITGRYELGELIAQGGMGAVYAARDTVLRRSVAVKILRPGTVDVGAARFRAEARITGQLQHPGVPPVHELGTLSDGGPFLAMKLIRGRTLADELKDKPSPAHDRPRLLQVFEQICQTVGFAHSHHVVHRDLKPANIMVGKFGEVQVMDWGLAKVLGAAGAPAESEIAEEAPPDTQIEPGRDDDGGSDTRAGSVVGTPGYMPPEQAKGEPIDERADVFSLGAVLCEILTGKPPYTGTRAEVRAKGELGHVAEAFDRLDDCGADPALVALAKRCLAPTAAERPANAGAVAEAVLAFRADAEQRAHRAELDRARAEAQAIEQRKRRRVQAVLGLTFTSLVVLGGAFGWWADRQTEQKKLRQAEFEREQARSEAEQARVTGELKTAEERAAADRRVRAAGARAQVPDLLRLAVDLRKQFKFREAATALDQARAVATGAAPDLVPVIDQATYDLGLVVALDRFRLSRFQALGGKLGAETDARYEQALREHGFDFVTGNVDDLAARLRASAASAALIDALDRWGLEDHRAEVRQRIWAVTAKATGHSWREQVLAARDSPKALNALLARVPPDQFPASLHADIGFYLFTNGGDSIGWLRRGLLRYPDDFWHHCYLMLVTAFTPERRTETLAHARTAIAIRPNDAALWHTLSTVLATSGDPNGAREAAAIARRLDPAFVPPTEVNVFEAVNSTPDQMIALIRPVLKANPNFAPGWGILAMAQLQKGALKEAEAAGAKALALDPQGLAFIHVRIAEALLKAGDTTAAERCFRAVAETAPWAPGAHAGMGMLLRHRNWPAAAEALQQAVQLDLQNGSLRAYYAEALAMCGYANAETEARNALRMAPNRPESLCALGAAMGATARHREAMDLFLACTRAHPDYADGYIRVCATKIVVGEPGAGIPYAEAAIKLNPKQPLYHRLLGSARVAAGDEARGLEALRAGLEMDPNDPNAYFDLARALVFLGRPAEARPLLQKNVELLRNWPKPPPAPAQLLAECERVIALGARADEVLAGRGKPADAAERLALAITCQNNLKRYATAVRLYREAFGLDARAVHPKYQNRFFAARTAILAASGQGTEPVPPEKRAEYRVAALAWLTDDLTAINAEFVFRRAGAREFARDATTYWLGDTTFATVRHPLYLSALPPDEADKWLALWDDVRKFRETTTVQVAPPPREK